MDVGEYTGVPVLVSGANGFIGGRLCNALAAAGAEVHAVSRSQQESRAGVQWWCADLADYSAAEDVFTRTQPVYVFHLAGIAAGSRDLSLVLPTFDSNLVSTVNMLVLAKKHGCRRFVLPGSMEEPEACDAGVIPSSPYAASKWGATVYTRMFHALYDVPTVILRVFMVYGPSYQDLNKLVPYVILSLLRGQAPTLGSGQRYIDWIYIDDVIEALLGAAMEEAVVGSSIDVGSGVAISVREMVEKLVEIVDPGIEIGFGGQADRRSEEEKVADLDSAKRLLRWMPRTSLEQGLRDTVEWYRQRVRNGEIGLSG
jgi:nucleoside-diphosphate-sugar epimerase